MANIFWKTVLAGALMMGLGLVGSPLAAGADHPFASRPPVQIDAYNAVVAAMLPGSVASDVRITGRLVRLDPYNAVVAASLLPTARAMAVGETYSSYALAPRASGRRLWEGSVRFGQ